jgi:uncharacterized protein
MAERIIDIRNRPAFLHDFYGRRTGTPEFDTAKWLNGRTGSRDPEHFVRSQDEGGYLDEIRSAGIAFAVVIGRDTPAIKNNNDEIAALVSRHRELVGVGSVDPDRLGAKAAVTEAERAIKILNLKAINLEPGFGSPPRHFDDSIFYPLYEALQTWGKPVFLMTGPTTPDLAYNNPDAIGRVARTFPQLHIVVHHGAWPRVNEIIGVAFRYANVTLGYVYLSAGRRALC